MHRTWGDDGGVPEHGPAAPRLAAFKVQREGNTNAWRRFTDEDPQVVRVEGPLPWREVVDLAGQWRGRWRLCTGSGSAGTSSPRTWSSSTGDAVLTTVRIRSAASTRSGGDR